MSDNPFEESENPFEDTHEPASKAYTVPSKTPPTPPPKVLSASKTFEPVDIGGKEKETVNPFDDKRASQISNVEDSTSVEDSKPESTFTIVGSVKAFLPLFLLLLFSSFLCLLIFAFTCWSFQEVTHTSRGSYLYNIDTGDKLKCSDFPSNETPFRFRLETDPQYLQCSWHTRNQALRFIISLIGFIFPFILFVVWMKKWRPKLFTWIYAIVCFIIGGLLFWAAIIDGNDTRTSMNWCNGDLKKNVTGSIVCGYWPYILTILWDIIGAGIEIICGVVCIRHIFKHMKS